jgi:hypothetical protein
MKKTLCIILPGKIGDIIICLPIAKYYADKGYEVIWPVWSYLIDNFIEYIDYVRFIPVGFQFGVTESLRLANNNNWEILDLSFTNQDCWNNENTKNFQAQTKSFDEYRYELAGVTFSEKWNLSYKRFPNKEESIFKSLQIKEKFSLAHLEGSDSRAKINFNNPLNIPIIPIKPITKSVFDWTFSLGRADYLIMYDSCFANLVEQLNLPNKKFFIKRSPPKATPILKNLWTLL